ncbi:MAG: hemin uptake protein HemP [Planctomycetota bacterium]|nr:MAG: hemin uptake protein HemP [Planctomycetota bacterium]REJ93468.1 MAG: hemin uptake protein HemP [Planctomycetota bacterium]
MNQPQDQKPEIPPAASEPEPRSARVYATDELFQGNNEIIIRHGVAEYRLRITRSNKLILNK